MAKNTLPCVADEHGNYTFTETATAAEILDLVSSILEQRLRLGDPLCSPDDTKRFLQLRLGRHQHEVFSVLFLDNRHRLIEFEEMFRGTIDGASVHPREVVKAALLHNAAAVIFSHNHPSGVAQPSEADRALTRRLTDALTLVDIRVLDHVVVGQGEAVSFAERRLI